jgi:hypothetical protein
MADPKNGIHLREKSGTAVADYGIAHHDGGVRAGRIDVDNVAVGSRLGSGANGILFKTGGNLAIENCVIRDFSGTGINIAPTGSVIVTCP